MTLYVDSSAYVSRYAPDEAHHASCVDIMDRHEDWVTSRLTLIEAPRGVQRAAPDPQTAVVAIAQFDDDATGSLFVDVDHGVVSLARAIALETGVKTLDAIHIASAKQVPDGELQFLTLDDRQARAAQSMGLRLAR